MTQIIGEQHVEGKKERKHSALRSKKSEVDMHVNSFSLLRLARVKAGARREVGEWKH